MAEPAVSILLFARTDREAAAWGRRFVSTQDYPADRLRRLALVSGDDAAPGASAGASASAAGDAGWQRLEGAGHRPGNRAAAVNRAAALVETPFLIVADCSLEPERGWIRALVAEAQHSSRIVAVAPKILAPGNVIAAVGAGLAAGYRWHDRGSGEVDTGRYDANLELYAVTLLGCLVNRPRFQEIGGLTEVFDTSYADIDLSIRWIEKGYRMRYAPGALVHRAPGAPGADRNPDPPEPEAEWERLILIARRFPDLLAAHLPAAGAVLARIDDAGERLATVLAHWPPTRDDAAKRRDLHRRLLDEPMNSPGLLREAWEGMSG